MAGKDIDWVRQLFESLDAMDTEGFLRFLADDARFRFGNEQTVIGKDAIHQAVEDFFSSIRGLKHRLLEIWVHTETVICQGEVTYTRTDNTKVTIPFVNIWRMEGDRIREYLIYIDITPLHFTSSPEKLRPSG